MEQTELSGKRAIRVVLVEDHAVVRAGCRILLRSAGNIEIVAELERAERAFLIYMEQRPDVLIMDLSLPGVGGLETIRRIVSRDPRARILVYSIHETTVYAGQALRAGARGYVTKGSSPSVLIEAVRQVAAGQVSIDSEIAQRLAYQRTSGLGSPVLDLATREFEVFRLLAEGRSVIEIACRLSLSRKTVANYSTRIKAKMGVDTIAELAHMAIRYGIVSVESVMR